MFFHLAFTQNQLQAQVFAVSLNVLYSKRTKKYCRDCFVCSARLQIHNRVPMHCTRIYIKHSFFTSNSWISSGCVYLHSYECDADANAMKFRFRLPKMHILNGDAWFLHISMHLYVNNSHIFPTNKNEAKLLRQTQLPSKYWINEKITEISNSKAVWSVWKI